MVDIFFNGNIKSAILGMGHVGTAVANNLLRKGFLVSAITDIKPELCQGFPDSVKVVDSAKEVAELSDVIVSGLFLSHFSTEVKPGLPKPPHVKQMFEGATGLLAGMDEGKVSNTIWQNLISPLGLVTILAKLDLNLGEIKYGQTEPWVRSNLDLT